MLVLNHCEVVRVDWKEKCPNYGFENVKLFKRNLWKTSLGNEICLSLSPVALLICYKRSFERKTRGTRRRQFGMFTPKEEDLPVSLLGDRQQTGKCSKCAALGPHRRNRGRISEPKKHLLQNHLQKLIGDQRCFLIFSNLSRLWRFSG